MNKAVLLLGLSSLLVACAASDDDGTSRSRSDRVVLDVRCSADGDCPAGFECETELEHGTSTSYCKSHEDEGPSAGAATSPCPPGFEQETEHGVVFCKPHGGGDAAATGAPSSTCASDADCPDGLECEIEHEHGVTTSFCKPHGGRGRDDD